MAWLVHWSQVSFELLLLLLLLRGLRTLSSMLSVCIDLTTSVKRDDTSLPTVIAAITFFTEQHRNRGQGE